MVVETWEVFSQLPYTVFSKHWPGVLHKRQTCAANLRSKSVVSWKPSSELSKRIISSTASVYMITIISGSLWDLRCKTAPYMANNRQHEHKITYIAYRSYLVSGASCWGTNYPFARAARSVLRAQRGKVPQQGASNRIVIATPIILLATIIACTP